MIGLLLEERDEGGMSEQQPMSFLAFGDLHGPLGLVPKTILLNLTATPTKAETLNLALLTAGGGRRGRRARPRGRVRDGLLAGLYTGFMRCLFKVRQAFTGFGIEDFRV